MGLCVGCAQWVWWSRLASHLEILRLMTRGLERRLRAGFSRLMRLRMA